MLRKHHKYLDRIIVFLLIFVLPIVMTALVEHFITNSKVDPAAYNGVVVAGTMLGVWGAMLGFMITALSIIMTLGDGKFITVVRGTSNFESIMIIMIATCIILFLATAFGAAVVCLNLWRQFCFSLLLYFVFGTGIAILLSMFYLFYIVLNSNK